MMFLNRNRAVAKPAKNKPGEAEIHVSKSGNFPSVILNCPDLGARDIARAGYKNASLGEMRRRLANGGIRVPDGFAVAVEAYHRFLAHNHLVPLITGLLRGVDPDNIPLLMHRSRRIHNAVMQAEFPAELVHEIGRAYHAMERKYGANIAVAVRSSSTVEDMPAASFAGQHDSCLNIQGVPRLLQACKEVYASLFSARALAYCLAHGLDLSEIAVSVGVQKMVRSDIGVSGVMFTLDTQTGFRDVVTIAASYGLGESIVQGSVDPDEFMVFKPTLVNDRRPIIKRQRGEKAIMSVTGKPDHGPGTLRKVPVSRNKQFRFSLDDDQVIELARQAVLIEQFCSALQGRLCPVDIEWAMDGKTGEIFIVQARPETVHSRKSVGRLVEYELKEQGWLLVSGKSVGHRIVAGRARVITDVADMGLLEPGEVLVTDTTGPEWDPVLSRAAAIVTDCGGRCCHSSTVARETGVPAVVGCGNATRAIVTGMEVTVACLERDVGQVYQGKLAYQMNERVLSELESTHTRLMLSLSNPERAFDYAGYPVDGIGLVRMEYILNNRIKVHPRALLEYEGQGTDIQFEIDELVAGYPDRRTYYIQRLAESLGMIAAAFYPKPVMVRFSDFKTNEYAALFGGESFEGHEENPVLGLRGAARYASVQFEQSFSLECEAIRYARDEMGFSNLHVVAPFVRTIKESRKLLETMARHGLRRSRHGPDIYLMCETPANVLLGDEFLEYFDGFSIGTSDLTRLALGADQDDHDLNSNDNGPDRAVLKLIYLAIDTCKRHNKHIWIAGEMMSRFPEVARWLVRQGIDGISMEPRNYLEIHKLVSQTELQISNADTLELKPQLKIPA